MKNINVRFLNFEGDKVLSLAIAEAVSSIVNEYLTKKSRPFLGTTPFMFTAKDAQDPAIYTDTANLREKLEALAEGVTVTLSPDLVGGVDIDPAELTRLIAQAVATALEKVKIGAEVEDEDESDELDEETQALLEDIESFESIYFEEEPNTIQIDRDTLNSPMDFLEFTMNVYGYLSNVRKANEIGCDYSEELVISIK